MQDQLVCFLGGIFLLKKKKKGRKTTASSDLILLKIPGYVSISLLVPEFFLLTFRLNSASLKGNKCQLHKEVVLMFFFFLPRTFCTTEPKHLILIDPGFRFSPDAQLFLRRWLMDFLHENIWACCLKSVIDLSKLFTEYILCDRHYIRC